MTIAPSFTFAAERGAFAINSGTAKIASYLSATPTGKSHRFAFDIVETRIGSTSPLHDFVVDYDKKLHLVLVSEDLKTFEHLHPVLAADGHFRGTFDIARTARYYAYADSTPKGLGQQVFRFGVSLGNDERMAAHAGSPFAMSTVGPYDIQLSTDSLKAGRESIIDVRLYEGKRPASDLHGYLGGAAHAVFINATTLTYAHVHPVIGNEASEPMKMDGMGAMSAPAISDTGHVPPHYALHVGAQQPGRYKLWLQFRGGSTLYAAPFWIAVR